MKKLSTFLTVVAVGMGMIASSAQADLATFKAALTAATSGKTGLSAGKAAAKVLKKFAAKEAKLVDKFTSLAVKVGYKLAGSKFQGKTAVALAKALKKLVGKGPQDPKVDKALAVVVSKLKGAAKSSANVAAVLSAISAGLSPADALFLCKLLYGAAGLPPNCPS